MHLPTDDAAALAAIEGAMVAIRRRQTRRALARTVPDADPALFDVVDAVEAGERVTVTDVAAALDVAQPRASKLVAAAVAAGLVRREADQRDGRRAFLALTATGRELCDRVHATRRTRFAAATRDWSADERVEFARLLTRFVDGLTDPS
ncbi:winged helix-turn-helix transcriptional regulator [Dactylosporangium vinaceum]|uniref:MarR family winged helix-turn-helix transcriptional regulator n=1 Tax=Dactylosporangium vinaceum TaxID=53362 RepID=A0ABV5M5B7_9ACTN|nr:MarR family winged helix-turn-helix transcriptional regulator [Dactylosporangium vinaceum]UAB95511.1 winged helix-turn-helix transcriptional regulator [Dactylosporangium vinaceum]